MSTSFMGKPGVLLSNDLHLQSQFQSYCCLLSQYQILKTFKVKFDGFWLVIGEGEISCHLI